MKRNLNNSTSHSLPEVKRDGNPAGEDRDRVRNKKLEELLDRRRAKEGVASSSGPKRKQNPKVDALVAKRRALKDLESCDTPSDRDDSSEVDVAAVAAAGEGPRRGGKIVARYDYRNKRGDLLFQVVRFEPKSFCQRRPDPAKPGKWIGNLDGVERVLYRLAELKGADPATPVFVVEGEKDVDRLVDLGLVTTCNPMGAGKWEAAYARELRGRRVIIIPDNDASGRSHADTVARSFQPLPSPDLVKRLELPGLPERGDVSDWLDAGGTVKKLKALARKAPNFVLEAPRATPATVPPRCPRPGRSSPPIPPARYDRVEVFAAIRPHLEELVAGWGLRFSGPTANLEGWRGCHAVDRVDHHPSASFNVVTGVYRDHRSKQNLRIFDLAAELKPESYPDWQAAVDALGQQYLPRGGARPAGAGAEADDEEATIVDVGALRERVLEIVAARDLASLYRDEDLLTGLARLESSDPTAFLELKTTLATLKRFSARDFADAVRQHRPDGDAPDRREPGGGSDDKVLIQIVQGQGFELFCAQDEKAYVRMPVNGHFETHQVRGTKFPQWLKYEFFRAHAHAPGPETFRSAIDVIEMLARQGDRHEVHVRTAEVRDPDDADNPRYYLDLGDDAWRAVEVTREGWAIVADPPVRFRRPKGMGALPEPVRGGSLDEIFDYVNLGDEGHRLLYLGWLLAALRARGPYPILILNGEQGAAKSSTSTVSRILIDPHCTPLRSFPREERDLMICAVNSGILAFDNLSHITPEESDALCRISTGGGFASRLLYTDGEEFHLRACRPILFNGIEEVASRGDLLQRSLLLTTPLIPDAARRCDTEFWDAFNAAHPRLLGALLDVMVGALVALPTLRLATLPRMADFAKWAEAVCRAAGHPEGAFLSAYAASQAEADEVALESSPVAMALVAYMRGETSWTGTAQDLLNELEAHTDAGRRRKNWPAAARGLGGVLRRVAAGLRRVGLQIDFERGPGRDRARLIRICRQTARPRRVR